MNEQSSLQLGLECLKSGKVDEAIQHLEQATAEFPDNYRALDFLGVAYAQKGLFNRAVGTLEAAVKLHPKSASVHYNLAQAYRADGIYDKAKDHYEQALRIDPMYVKAEAGLKLIPSIESDMASVACAWHTGEPAIDKCQNCHLPVCTECKNSRGGVTYCPKCIEKLKLD
ncbi:MAG TPA: tetratricopeptide repeat protein [Armatimonadota bacterium]